MNASVDIFDWPPDREGIQLLKQPGTGGLSGFRVVPALILPEFIFRFL